MAKKEQETENEIPPIKNLRGAELNKLYFVIKHGEIIK